MIKYQNAIKLLFRSASRPVGCARMLVPTYLRVYEKYSFDFSTTKKISEQQLAQAKQKGEQFYKNHVEDIIELEKIQDWTNIVSTTQEPMLIDFYADWCGPCKKLTPRLEERVKKAEGKLKLLKINIDKFGQIANIFQIKSVPTVYLIYGGKAVDAFTGDVTDQKLDKFLESAGRVSKFDRVEEEVMKQLNEGQKAIRDKQYEKAETILAPLKTAGVKEQFGYVKDIFLGFVYGQLGKTSSLKALMDSMKAHEGFYLDKPEFKDLYLNLSGLCEEIEKAKSENSEMGQWRERLQKQPANLQLKFQAAQFYKVNQLAEEALELLLAIVKTNKDWEDKKANKAMLAFFKQLGPTSPITQKYRKLLQRALN